MEGRVIEISELEKKLAGFANIPKGDENTAYVFFQSKDNSRYIISTEKRKIMAAELRMGKYDRIMTIHRGEFTDTIRGEIACEEEEHSFFIEIGVRYFIADPERIYSEHIYQPSHEIRKYLSGIESQLDADYSFRNRAGFKKALSQLVKEKLGLLTYLRCSFYLKVDVDDSAKKIIGRMLEHEIKISEADLETVEKRTELENSHELEQIRLDNERRIAELSAQLQQQKVDQLGELIRKYGPNAGNMIEHVNGGMTGSQLSEVINRTARDNREELVNMIIKLKGEGIISKDLAAKSSVAALGMGLMESVDMQERKEVDQESEEVTQEREKFKWNDAD